MFMLLFEYIVFQDCQSVGVFEVGALHEKHQLLQCELVPAASVTLYFNFLITLKHEHSEIWTVCPEQTKPFHACMYNIAPKTKTHPSNAEATSLQSTQTQRSLKTI